MTELIQERKPARFMAFFECTFWGALVYAAWQMTSGPQTHWSGSAYAAAGGVIFGIGAFVNGACAFGSVGHFGNGDTQYGFTFLGMYAVSTVASLANLLPPVMTSSLSLQVSVSVTLSMLVVFAVLRLAIQRNNVTSYLKMTCAMLAIAVAYATIVLLKPDWSIALSHARSLPSASIAIAAAMFAGSIGSRWLERGRTRIRWPSLRGALRRLAGGTLMGGGAALIPGGNDTLMLVGLPTGAQEAALAYLLFAVSIAVLVRTIGSPARAWS